MSDTCEHWKPQAALCSRCINTPRCGCCGAEGAEPWCKRCSAHVLHLGGPEWDRTWFAQTGTDCPFQE